MTGALTLDPAAAPMVHLVAIEDAPAGAPPPSPGEIAARLGLDPFDASRAAVVDPAELKPMTLDEYLEAGQGVDPAALDDAERARLRAVRAPVLVLPTSAAGGVRQSVTPEPGLKLLGSYPELADHASFRPLPAGGAEGLLTGRPPAPHEPVRPRLMLGVAVLVFMALALLLLGVF